MEAADPEQCLGLAPHVAERLVKPHRVIEQRKLVGVLAGLAGVGVPLAQEPGVQDAAAGQGRRDDARAILAEAGDLATASGARRILRSVAEARSAIGG